jgi:S1-C subfamily serine protease
MAIGNPFTLSNTVTVGVVSAVGRQTQASVAGRFEEMIQTDAAINRGNSGGPLLNIRGEVIGINTKILTDDGTGNVGVGFAIPINTVSGILTQLRQGKVTRGRIGVSVDREPLAADVAEDFGLPNRNGALVKDVVPGGPAATAGIRISDVIVEFNGKAVKDNNDLVAMVTQTAPGTTVPVKLYRGGKPQTLNVKVEELDLTSEQEQLVAQNPQQRPERAAPKPTTGFGMSIAPLTPAVAREFGLSSAKGGAIITSVEPFGTAAQEGLAPGDVIVTVNEQAVSSVEQVSAALDKVVVGRTARLVIVRDGKETLVIVRKR